MQQIAPWNKGTQYIIPFGISFVIVILILYYFPAIQFVNKSYIDNKIQIINLDKPDNLAKDSNENISDRFSIFQPFTKDLYSNNFFITMNSKEINNRIQSKKLMNIINQNDLCVPQNNSIRFDTSFGSKIRTEYQMLLNKINGVLGYKENEELKLKERLDHFKKQVLDYINDPPIIRSWYTLWILKRSATHNEKIELITHLSALRHYCTRGSTIEQEKRLTIINSILAEVPEKLQEYIRIY